MLKMRWNKRIACYFILTFGVVIGLQLRLKALYHLDGQYLVGSDAYRLLRQSKQIASEGHLPKRDLMRHPKLGLD
jgi:asparagine N-glycosylation enzyme membrane subunit Stt3